jgi:hypothetical protein
LPAKVEYGLFYQKLARFIEAHLFGVVICESFETIGSFHKDEMERDSRFLVTHFALPKSRTAICRCWLYSPDERVQL